MCGIVGAIAERNVTPILLEGLKQLEYRGYDSAGIAIIAANGDIQRQRGVGKVSIALNPDKLNDLTGGAGIAHTRWATHGKPSEANAHPLMSGDTIAIVHNGIIENHEILRTRLKAAGYQFQSETDTEVVAHLLHYHIAQGLDFVAAAQAVAAELEGAFALVFLYKQDIQRIIAIRHGCPLVIGIGHGEHFVASDHFALLSVAHKFVHLEEGDIAEIRRDGFNIWDPKGLPIQRPFYTSDMRYDQIDRGDYRHFMLKEIFEQPKAIAATLEGRLGKNQVFAEAFGAAAPELFSKTKQIQIVACGTSYHAAMVARYWLEGLAGVPCQVEIASEFRYRHPVIQPSTLFVTLSQSGETLDTLEALRLAKSLGGYLGTLTICNAPESALVRESDLSLLTHAGREIGVASTKAFTAQLTALLMLTVAMGRHHTLSAATESTVVKELNHLPELLKQALTLDDTIRVLAASFVNKGHTLFLGRGTMYPIALEGALKLKELSYIHAEAYPAGELKHGPLALVDKDMPVVAVAPNDELLAKLKSNLDEVRARGGELIVFADGSANLKNGPGVTIIDMPPSSQLLAPLLYTIPLQLLSYHVAVLKGTDVDQPRNLAKSVTVE